MNSSPLARIGLRWKEELKTINPDPWATILAGSESEGSGVTIRDYSNLYAARDRAKIASLIRLRFTERYLDPALESPERHGFSILAICCLMVEALESFRNGWRSTSGKSEAAFCSFFQAHDEFKDLRPVAHDFYRAVRCGILHQAETTDGWRVHRKQGLYFESGGVRCVSASEFGKALKSVLARYHGDLISVDWNDPLWRNARRKLQAICRNCGLPDADVATLS